MRLQAVQHPIHQRQTCAQRQVLQGGWRRLGSFTHQQLALELVLMLFQQGEQLAQPQYQTLLAHGQALKSGWTIQVSVADDLTRFQRLQ